MSPRVRSKAALLASLAFVAAAAYSTSTGSAGQGLDTLVVDRSFEIRTSDPQRAFEPTAAIVDRGIYDTLLTFKGEGIIGGSLADGSYTLKIKAARVRNDVGLLLDGDEDGTPGGNALDAFFRKFGDADGDKDVDDADAALFDSTFGKQQGDEGFLAFFDYNGDGKVNKLDRKQFRQRLR